MEAQKITKAEKEYYLKMHERYFKKKYKPKHNYIYVPLNRTPEDIKNKTIERAIRTPYELLMELRNEKSGKNRR